MQQKSNNKMGVFNIFIIAYNFISVLINSLNNQVSYFSFIILALNLFVTITSLKNGGKSGMTIACLVIEILTGIILILSVI